MRCCPAHKIKDVCMNAVEILYMLEQEWREYCRLIARIDALATPEMIRERNHAFLVMTLNM